MTQNQNKKYKNKRKKNRHWDIYNESKQKQNIMLLIHVKILILIGTANNVTIIYFIVYKQIYFTPSWNIVLTIKPQNKIIIFREYSMKKN